MNARDLLTARAVLLGILAALVLGGLVILAGWLFGFGEVADALGRALDRFWPGG